MDYAAQPALCDPFTRNRESGGMGSEGKDTGES
jgi:hypothetical protein